MLELSIAHWDWWLASSGQGDLAEQVAPRGTGRAGRAVVLSLLGSWSPTQSCPDR